MNVAKARELLAKASSASDAAIAPNGDHFTAIYAAQAISHLVAAVAEMLADE